MKKNRAMMASMINRKSMALPEFRFLALAVCLLPLGILSFHSNWPPLGWKHTHFAYGDIGEAILECSGLFFVFALAYFFFPRIFRRRMNEVLGQIHFWLNVTAFLVLLALPIYFNLIFHSLPDEAKPGRIFRAFGSSVASVALGIQILAAIQIFFLANGLWSVFRGERVQHVTHKVESLQLTTDELLKRMPKEQAIILVQTLLRKTEEFPDAPDIPAAKVRLETVLEELKRS
jgi:hypothetical protein